MSNIYSFKIIVLGDSQTGKTCLIKRFCDNTFTNSTMPTIGVNDRKIELNAMNKKITLTIWDTAGQDKFRAINNNYYRGADGALLVFDLTNLDSFKNTTRWLKEFKDYAENGELILVGNKLDLIDKRQVSEEEAKNFATENHMDYIETSAKEGTGVAESFTYLGELALKNFLKGNGMSMSPSRGSIKVSKNNIKKSGCC